MMVRAADAIRAMLAGDVAGARAARGLAPLADADAWAVVCSGCGSVLGDRRDRRYWGAQCEPCVARARAWRLDEARAAARDSVPTHFRWPDLDGSALRARVTPPSAINEARAEIDFGGLVLLLSGDAGSGKTSLACALLLGHVASGEHGSARYVTSRDLGRADRDSRLGAEPPILRAARAASMLVIDELGSEPSGREAVRDIIVDRHAAERPTILASWLGRRSVGERYGAGVERRIGRVIRLGASVAP